MREWERNSVQDTVRKMGNREEENRKSRDREGLGGGGGIGKAGDTERPGG
jgi:hypothetical protein